LIKRFLYVLWLALISVTNLYSQDEDLKDLHTEGIFFSLSESTPEMVKFVNGLENKRVLNFGRNLLETYPDTIKSPEKIKFVSVGYNSPDELEKNIQALQRFPNLEYLEIKAAVQFRKSDQKDTLVIPENIKRLPNLKYLQLTGSYQLDYDELFIKLAQLPSLEYLGLPHSLEEVVIPGRFTDMKSLKGIKISGFKKVVFPSNMSAMHQLESIVLPAEPYEALSAELIKFSTLPELKNLAIRFVKLEEDDLRQFRILSKLEKLYLTNVEIESVQLLLDHMPEENNLKELSLQNLKSKNGISDYNKLKQLESLHISSYPGFNLDLDESLYDLKNLKSLTIHTDSLSTLSEKLGELSNLETLNLSYNKITSLPESIGDLISLKSLLLRNNRIISLPLSFSNLRALEVLDISNNSLQKLPHNFGNLTRLIRLNLNNNNLLELPGNFGQLKNLEFLNLNINYLKALPDDIGNLTSLIRLNLDDNFLTRLPETFTRLENLRLLQLSYNKLSTLPEDFGNLRALEEIFLGGNKNNLKPSTYLVNSGIQVDESRPTREFNEMKTLPHSISRLKNLKRIYLRQMETLDGEALFEIFFKVPSKEYQLDISNTGISYLPQTGWENFQAGSLNMGGNVIQSIPPAIMEAPYLSEFIFKLSKEDGLSYHLRGKAKLNAFFEEKGFIDFDSLPETEEMAKAYLENAYNRKYTEGNNILELINKAFTLDSTYTENNVRASTYADALLHAGDFTRAIKYYDRAIDRDTANGPYILNFIHPNFKNRAKSHLAVGDTVAAINGLVHVSQRFSSGDWTKAAVLASAVGKDSAALGYFTKGEEFYKNYIKGHLEAGQVDYGYHLSLLELYIIQEDLSKASDYLGLLKQEPIGLEDKQILLEYLEQVLAILQDEMKETEMNNLSRKIIDYNQKISSWSFDLMNLWLKLSKIDMIKKERIRNLTRAMENKI